MKIRNKNFLKSSTITRKEISQAFVIDDSDKEKLHESITDLIGEGWLIRRGDRYFKPTSKLLDEAFLPKSRTVFLDDNQRRFLSYHNAFYKDELVNCFDENERIVEALIKDGWFKLSQDRRLRKSEMLDDLLIEGGDIIKLKEREELP